MFQDGKRDGGGIQQSEWQTMAKTVREVDEEKVKDSKEDIDTLLVFVSHTS